MDGDSAGADEWQEEMEDDVDAKVIRTNIFAWNNRSFWLPVLRARPQLQHPSRIPICEIRHGFLPQFSPTGTD